MRVIVRATPAGTVGDLDKRKDLQLADQSQDVDFIKEYFGNRPAVREFDGFLVKIEDGGYTEVYGFPGNIAYVYKPVFKITRTFVSPKKTVVSKKPRSKGRGTGAAGIGGVR